MKLNSWTLDVNKVLKSGFWHLPWRLRSHKGGNSETYEVYSGNAGQSIL